MWVLPASAVLAALLAGGGLARAASTTVTEKNNPTFGTILADSASKTLYTLTSNGSPVLCTGVCAQVWPPLTVPPGTTVTGPPGVCCLSSTPNANGNAVTYKGDPLYRYVNDRSPSDATGDGVMSFGGTWHVVPVASSASTSTTTPPTSTVTTVPTATTSPGASAPTTGSANAASVASPSASSTGRSASVGAATPLGAPGTGGTPPRGSDVPFVIGISALGLGLVFGALAIRRRRGGD